MAMLCEAGLSLFNAKKYEEAEESWKKALQISQNDTRTLMHYAVLMRDIKKKPEVADQMMQQATGNKEWHTYITPMIEQNREGELWRRPVVRKNPPHLSTKCEGDWAIVQPARTSLLLLELADGRTGTGVMIPVSSSSSSPGKTRKAMGNTRGTVF